MAGQEFALPTRSPITYALEASHREKLILAVTTYLVFLWWPMDCACTSVSSLPKTKGWVQAHCELLVGPSSALIRSAFDRAQAVRACLIEYMGLRFDGAAAQRFGGWEANLMMDDVGSLAETSFRPLTCRYPWERELFSCTSHTAPRLTGRATRHRTTTFISPSWS